MEFLERLRRFTGEENPKICQHDHKLFGTAVFYQSSGVGVLQCAECKGWQDIRKPIEKQPK